MKQIWNIVVSTVAIIYFLLDAIFATIAVPLSRWIGGNWAFERIHRWILSLRPYPTLLLFVVPLIILEPAKPVAAYLVATGHALSGLCALAVAEIIKLMLIERLFSVSRDKLLSIPTFAWGYGKYSAIKTWFTSLESWRLAMRWAGITRNAVLRIVDGARIFSRRRQTHLAMTPISIRRVR